VVPAESNADTQ